MSRGSSKSDIKPRDSKRKAIGYDVDFSYDEAHDSLDICPEGPYCQVCHDVNILADYLETTQYATGIVIEEQILSERLLDKLSLIGPTLERFQWIILKQAYGGTEVVVEGQPRLYDDFSSFFLNPGFQNIRRLGIISQKLSDKAMAFLGESPVFRNLRELIIPNNDLTDSGVEIICESSNFQKLCRLNLSYNKLSQKSFELLLNPANLPDLEELYLSGYSNFNFFPRKIKKGLRILDISNINRSVSSMLPFLINNKEIDIRIGAFSKGYPSEISNWFNSRELDDFVCVGI